MLPNQNEKLKENYRNWKLERDVDAIVNHIRAIWSLGGLPLGTRQQNYHFGGKNLWREQG